jgi:hypothetical protein
MEGRTDKSILGKAILFALLVILITAVGGLMPLIAGNKIESKKLDNQRPFFPAIPSESVKLRLASGGFDPLMKPEPDKFTERLSIKAYAHGEQGYYIVQFDGPVRAQQRKKLEQLGAQVFDYLPDFAFIVKMNDESRVAVGLMENVRWVGIYQPAYRIEPALAATVMAGETSSQGEFIVTLFPGEDVGLIAEQIEHLGGAVLDVSEYHQRAKLKIRLFLEDLQTVSKITGVKWIERAPIWKLHNNVAAGIMDATDVWNIHNLYGAGQVVCVADTGLDQGSTVPASLHDDFEDGSGISRVSTIFDRAGDGATSDINSGHGTHVAGSVLGNGAVSGSNPATHTYINSYAGIAPEATLVFQALEDNTTGALSGIPDDLNTLFSQAYGAGATIHTNSWGAFQGGAYTSFSEDVDQFVWNNKDFLVLFSAGNDGVDTDGDGVIDLTSMESPATAKNCITVGATENNRPTGSSPSPGYNSSWGTLWPDDYPAAPISSDHVSDDADGIAAFSSRGPCLDGRFKPDIVAPGTNIISTKSSLTANTALWGKGGLSTSGPEAQYIFSGGTSMSTPLTAGVATLARDFFTDVEGITPSAALIKAILLNGAADISPGQYGTGSTQEIPDTPRPNNVEGWGRIELETSIFPVAPKTLRYVDKTTGLETLETHIYNFTVGDGTVPLKATLVWSDYPGSAVSGGGLTNDLDLSVIDPLGTTHYANRANQRGQTQVISYDDGVEGGSYLWPGASVGVRFTPTAYPARLDKGLFLLRSTSYPNTFTYNVYDGSDGSGPQNLLASGTTTIRGSGWHVVDLSNHAVTVNSGDFFLAIELNDALWWYFDDTSPDGRSWDYNGVTWSKWSTNDYMFRAVVTTPDHSTPYDRVNNVVGIDISSPATGAYSLHIEGYNVPQGPQPCALLVTGGTLSALTELIPPTAPSNLSAGSASETQINLTWTDNSSNESGFKIERKKGAGGTYSEITTVGADVTSYNDTGLSEATSYYYRVRAYNSAGNSSYCDEANATTYPAAPSGLSASAASSSQINLSWTDNSSGESGFKIERKTGSGGTYSQITTVSANVTTYSNIGLSEATTYYFRVRAYNAAGNSNYSNEANATTSSAGGGGGGGGGCFIATAAYGSYMEPHVMVLRDFRDRVLLTNNVGRSFVELYYTYSPPVADFIASHDTARLIVRWSLMPVVGMSWMALNIGLIPSITIILLILVLIDTFAVVLFKRMWMQAHRT